MNVKDLSTYLGNHCRFNLRGGKDIYGVIWQNNAKFFFSSKERHDSLLNKEEQILISEEFDQINPEDILKVVRLDVQE